MTTYERVALVGHDALVAALRAVLDLHAESGGECQECVHPADSHWRVDYPCPTVRAVEAALGEVAS